MKRGFALLETIIVITFVTVSLLLLYGTFTSMVDNSKKNVLYDDATHIYQMFYLKEYLELNGLQDYLKGDIVMLSCDDFNFNSCKSILKEFSLEHIYLVKYGLQDYDEEHYASSFNQYLKSLSNKDVYDYRLVGEFLIGEKYQYASIGVIKNES